MANTGRPFSTNFPSALFLREDEISQRISEIEKLSFLNTRSTIRITNLISCLDLTSLNAVDTPEAIDSLLQKAILPLAGNSVRVAAVCVFQPFVAQCVSSLKDLEIDVACVAGGFPSGQMDVVVKCADIERSVALGANEIDVVINRTHPLTENWEALYNEVRAFKKSCGSAHLKVIIATGELQSHALISKTSWICMLAGADFIKTSTGLEKVNATLEAGLLMMTAIREYHILTDCKVGFKPAGGIRNTVQAQQWIQLLKEELGVAWANKTLFRIGASSLLDDLVNTYTKN